MSGAVDLEKCPALTTGRDRRGRLSRRCRCGVCAVCGFAKHAGVHGPIYGEPPGSTPYGHEFQPIQEADDVMEGIPEDTDAAAAYRAWAPSPDAVRDGGGE